MAGNKSRVARPFGEEETYGNPFMNLAGGSVRGAGHAAQSGLRKKVPLHAGRAREVGEDVRGGPCSSSAPSVIEACASLTSSMKEMPKSHSSIRARSAIDLPSRFKAGFMKVHLAKDNLY
ncbi:hypothetical protein G5I_07752 [Acromyrmex echinatior]|uniref:Uncharacterized protein n=1 Tax=Acromyrmex echinatior TaxID=103372 RepID=F4WPN3_ACREC|nr:hypothetical protein G5I_07752 [Acromyrmex echinatior]